MHRLFAARKITPERAREFFLFCGCALALPVGRWARRSYLIRMILHDSLLFARSPAKL
jgi:hypothetical protein